MATDAQSADRRMIPSAVAQYQAEGRWLTLVRLLFIATCLSWFGLLAFALPSLAGITAISDAGSAIALVSVFWLASAGCLDRVMDRLEAAAAKRVASGALPYRWWRPEVDPR